MNRPMICLLLALVLCVSLTACNQDRQKDPTNPAVQQNPITESGTAATNEADKQSDSATAENTESTTQETVNTPETQQSAPLDAEVSAGVVNGEGSSDLEGDSQDTTVTSKPTEGTSNGEPDDDGSQVDGDFDLAALTYEGYNAMSGEDQRKVIAMFGSTDDFIRWYKVMEAKYMAEHPDIEIGDGKVNAEDIPD